MQSRSTARSFVKTNDPLGGSAGFSRCHSDDTSLSEHSSRISYTVFRILHPYFGVLLFLVYPAASESQQSRSADRTIGGAARGRGKGGSSSRGGSSARGSQRQPPGHDVNLLEDDKDCEEGEQYVYSATGARLGTMKTAEQFENPAHERFALGVFGETDLGANAFDLDVLALQDETDDADREFAELSPKCLARSAHHVMPPELAECSSNEDDEGDRERRARLRGQ